MPVELLRRGLEVFGPIFAQGLRADRIRYPKSARFPKKPTQVLDKPAEEQKVLASCGQPSLGVHVRVVNKDRRDVAQGDVGEIIAQSDIDHDGILEKAERNR